jgi:Uma2 family endonuclease
MASTKTSISVAEYLRTSLDPDREYVDGEIVERNVGEKPQSKVQGKLIQIFYELAKIHPLFCFPELRMKLAEGRYRIPDVAVFAVQEPEENVPDAPPLAAIEIVSPDDRYTEILRKLEEYRAWGVPHVWLADPWLRQLHVYTSAGLREVRAFTLPEFDVEIPIDRIV